MPEENTFTPPTLEESRQLYEAAVRLKELAPWAWMDESDIFGVQNPETGELGFVSVMGMAGEHFAVALYQGAEGLYGILDFVSTETGPDPQQLLDIPQLQASFENRDQLEKSDRDAIKQLGLKFRGAHAWPMFRSYRPGFMPWFITATEARFLTHALGQTLEVAPRLRDDSNLLYAEDEEDEERYFVRVPRQQDGALVWEDEMMRVPPPEPERLTVMMDREIVERLKQLPQHPLTLEVELFSLPTGVGERGERPFRPYMLMLADSRSGMIVATELLKPEPSLREMQAQVPMKLAGWLAEAGLLPAQILGRSELLLALLRPFAAPLRVKLRQSDRLPSIDAAMSSMFDLLGGL